MTAKVKNVIPQEQKSLGSYAQKLRFHVLDELHAYRDSQGADVAMRVNGVRNAFIAYHLQYNGTSAMLSSSGSFEEERQKSLRSFHFSSLKRSSLMTLLARPCATPLLNIWQMTA